MAKLNKAEKEFDEALKAFIDSFGKDISPEKRGEIFNIVQNKVGLSVKIGIQASNVPTMKLVDVSIIEKK